MSDKPRAAPDDTIEVEVAGGDTDSNNSAVQNNSNLNHKGNEKAIDEKNSTGNDTNSNSSCPATLDCSSFDCFTKEAMYTRCIQFLRHLVEGCSVICTGLCIVFHLVIAVIGVTFVVDLVVVLFFSTVVPSTPATACSGVMFLASLLPWCVIVLAQLFQWRCWSASYTELKTSLFFLLFLAEQRCKEDGNDSDGDSNKQKKQQQQRLLDYQSKLLAEGSQNYALRVVLQYFIPVIIWVISFGIGSANAAHSMWFFFVTGTVWTIINVRFDFARFEARPVQQGIMMFVILRNGSRYLEIFTCSLAIFSLIAIARNDIAFVPGGKDAVAVSFVLLGIAIIVSIITVLVKPFGFAAAGAPVNMRNPIVVLAFIRDAVYIFIGSTIVAAEVHGVKSAVFYTFLGLIVAAYAVTLYNGKDQYVLLYEAESEESAQKEALDLATEERGNRRVSALPALGHDSGNQNNNNNNNNNNNKVVALANSAGNPVSTSAFSKAKGHLFVARSKSDIIHQAEATFLLISQRTVSREQKLADFLRAVVLEGEEDSVAPDRFREMLAVEQQARRDQQKRDFMDDIVETDDRNEFTRLDTAPDEWGSGPLRMAYFVVVFLLFMLFALTLIPSSSGSAAAKCPGSRPLPNATSSLSRNMSAFALCPLVFPTAVADKPFSVVDMTALIVAAYHVNRTRSSNVYFPSEKTEILIDKNSTNVGGIAVNFVMVRFPERKAIVCSVRGSSSRQDWIVNVARSIESIAVVAGFSALPIPELDSVSSVLVEMAGSVKYGITDYAPLVREELQAQGALYPDHVLYVVGHSAGGAVAATVAALSSNVRAVTLSPTGIALLNRKMGFDLVHAHNVVANFCPRGDIVTRIDYMVGVQQYFTQLEPCSGGNAYCHSSALSLETISTVCGDALGRTSAPTEDEAGKISC